MKTVLSNEEWFNIKELLRQNGYIPTKKIIYEVVEKMENELEQLSFGRIDTHCKEEQQKIEEQRQLYKKSINTQLTMWFNALENMGSPYRMHLGGNSK